MDSLQGKRILVIGASSGIGAQTAVTLSEHGANVILAARRGDRLREVMERLAPGEHAYDTLDVNEVELIGEKIGALVRERGKLDGMVYAAGIGLELPLRDLSYKRALPFFQTNYFGFLESVRQVSKRGRYNSGMHIVAISSVASMTGQSANTVYSATKAAVDASIRCMAKELADKGICINSVAPSMIEAQMYYGFLERNGNGSEAQQKLLNRQYLGIGKTTDVANAVCFLLSPESRFITGIALPVDGGYTSC